MFAACAAAQLGWGWAVVTAPRLRRSLLVTGLVINGGAVLVWAASRTTGIAFINSLKIREEVGTQDLTCALFAALSVAAIVCILVRPDVRAAFPAGWPAVIAVCAFLLAVPALTAAHTHPAQAHDHVTAGGEAAAGHNHANTTDPTDEAATDHNHSADAIAATAEAHDHTSTAVESTPDAHEHAAGTTATTTAHDHSAASTDEEATTHDHSSDTDTTGNGAPAHDHSATTTTTPETHNHDPGSTDPGSTTDPGPPITSLDDPRLTPDQVQRAVAIIVGTINGMSGYITEADVVAAGYQSIGDGGHPGEYEHFIKWPYLSDGFELDSGHIESIVLKMNADGTKRVVAAMYALTWGDTLADVPDIAGGLTVWHDHDNMCFSGDQFTGLTISGVCPAGTLRDTPPMLDVWIEENACGPFAVIDNEPHECTGSGHTH
jgi:hypothetical protein